MSDISTCDETHFSSDWFEYRLLCNVIHSPRAHSFENKAVELILNEH